MNELTTKKDLLRILLRIAVGYAICRVPISPEPNLKRCQQVAVTVSRATSRDNRVSTL